MYRSPFVELEDMVKELDEPVSRIKRRAFDLKIQRPPKSWRTIIKKRVSEVDMDNILEGCLLFICMYSLMIPRVLVVWN